VDRASKPVLLILSQVYIPDPAAVGQHIADVAEEMVHRGWRVVVYTSRRGYDDPATIFPARETLHGVEVRRLPLSSFGKHSIPVRLVGQSLFMAQAVLRSLFMRRIDAVLVSTSPPFAGIGGAIVSLLRRAPLTWWVMDINPDQMITSGRLAATSLIARCFDAMNRVTLRSASRVVVLDRFMRDRILAKCDVGEKLTVIGPWAHEDRLEPLPHDKNPFRERHGLSGKVVVMYSGNHGFSTPVATLLEAAQRLSSVPDLQFVFIGGGVLKKDVDRFVSDARPPNIVSLPYQPLETIRYSLSAADIQVVSIANEAVGVVHSCKIYGAMAVGRAVLSIGPGASHANDIVVRERIGWSCRQGEVESLVATLRVIAGTPREDLEEMGLRARRALQRHYSREQSLDAICDVICQPPDSALMDRAP